MEKNPQIPQVWWFCLFLRWTSIFQRFILSHFFGCFSLFFEVQTRPEILIHLEQMILLEWWIWNSPGQACPHRHGWRHCRRRQKHWPTASWIDPGSAAPPRWRAPGWGQPRSTWPGCTCSHHGGTRTPHQRCGTAGMGSLCRCPGSRGGRRACPCPGDSSPCPGTAPAGRGLWVC